MSLPAGTDSRIAVVGASVRVPGADTVDALWSMIVEGRVGLERLDRDEQTRLGVPPAKMDDPRYVPVVGRIRDTECFDAAYFGIGPRDAALMDPQHRHFLECVVEAFDDASIDPGKCKGPVGVFASSGMNTYLLNNLMKAEGLVEELGMFLVRHTGNDKDFLATEVSYHLNLTGPSINVQTACSSSLVAVHLAVQSLLAGEVDLAIAGGCTIEVGDHGYLYAEGEVLSSDGVCRAFDAASSGTVFASGAGVVVLKRLEDALADGDLVRAVILGSAVNNDGGRKVGFLAPSVEGHAAVVAEALAVANVDAASIGYVEAHGTGTAIGDPIEFDALASAFRLSTQERGFCAIGSIKPNVGHLDTAAGVVSLIKAMEAVRHGVIPPLTNHKEPSSHIALDSSPFYLPTVPRKWLGLPRRAGISSLGVGGTNAHIIVEESPPPSKPLRRSSSTTTLVVSGKTAAASVRAAERLAAAMERDPTLSLDDAASTLLRRRTVHQFRTVVTARGRGDAIAGLQRAKSPICVVPTPRVVFLLPGPGPQHLEVLRSLIADGAARDVVARSRTAFARLEADAVVEQLDRLLQGEASEPTNAPSVALPMLAVAELAVAAVLRASGVGPDLIVGNSMGELVAAHISGCLSFDDLLRLVAIRGELLEETGGSASVVGVDASADVARGFLVGEASIAVASSDSHCVVSGPTADVQAFKERIEAAGHEVSIVALSAAPHSSVLDPILPIWRNALNKVTWGRPTTPWCSNIDGRRIDSNSTIDWPEYWARQFRETVRLDKSLAAAMEGPGAIFVEVGPGLSIGGLLRELKDGPLVISTMPRRGSVEDEIVSVQRALGEAWAAGVPVRTDLLAAEFGAAHLPGYTFERSRHWVGPSSASRPATEEVALPRDKWILRPSWQLQQLPTSQVPKGTILILSDGPIGAAVASVLRSEGVSVITVDIGECYGAPAADSYVANPDDPADLEAVLRNAQARGSLDGVVHLWSLSVGRSSTEKQLRNHLARTFHPLLTLACVPPSGELNRMPILVVTNGQQSVDGSERIDPLASLALGPVLSLPREHPGVVIRNVDLSRPGRADRRRLARRIVSELAHLSRHDGDDVVAYREARRLVRTFTPATLPAREDRAIEAGTYLVTGAFGAIGSELCRDLAGPGRNLVLVGSRRGEAETPKSIKQVAAESRDTRLGGQLEAAGSEVLVVRADLENRSDLLAALDAARLRFGSIDGIFHLAGVLDDGIAVSKTPESIRRVLGAKALGGLLLAELTKNDRHTFLVLFGSTSGLLGPAGQVDYAAANAVLDGLAAADPFRILTIDWGIWRQVGMSAQSSPLRASSCIYEETLSFNDWPLLDHRVTSNTALLPGMVYLEVLAQAALSIVPTNSVVLEDFRIEAPTFVQHDQRVTLCVRNAGSDIEVLADQAGDGASGRAVMTSAARVRRFDDDQAPVVSNFPLAELLQNANPSQLPFRCLAEQKRYVDFGLRWECLKSAWTALDSVVGYIALPDALVSDLVQHPFHPALLDLGISVGLSLDNHRSNELHVPVYAERIEFFRSLDRDLYVVATRSPRAIDRPGWTTIDLQYVTRDGACLVRVTGLVLRAVDPKSFLPSEVEPPLVRGRMTGDVPILRLGQRHGIGLAEGFTSLREICASGQRGQMVVSSLPLEVVNSALFAAVAGPPSAVQAARPDGSIAYRAPATPGEQSMTALWEATLGIAGVGLDDDFFELGGHSLLAVRLLGKVRETFAVRLGLAALFEGSTPSLLLRQVEVADRGNSSSGTNAPFESVVLIRPGGPKPAVFCVHGAGGNVLNFTGLVRHLPDDRPVFGVQAAGTEGSLAPDPSIDAMVQRYVEDLSRVYSTGDIHLIGYSGGGVLALEMASHLVAKGRTVGPIILLDTFHPSTDGRSRMERIANVGRNVRQEGFWPVVRWTRQFLAYMLGTFTPNDDLDVGYGDPSAFGFVNLEKHFARVISDYQPHVYHLDVHLITVEQIKATMPALHGWGRWIDGAFTRSRTAGTHRTMLDPMNAPALAAIVATSIERVRFRP